jgi:hypothetical protein
MYYRKLIIDRSNIGGMFNIAASKHVKINNSFEVAISLELN